MIVGYARVSTDGQTVDAQVKQLRDAGAEKIFRETASGAKTDRRELARPLSALRDGDTLLVTRLDRLARSTRDLLNTLDNIAKAGAGFRSLGDAWADTTTPHGCLMLTVLGGLAEFERELIRARTGEGRERAKARGGSLARPGRRALDAARWWCGRPACPGGPAAVRGRPPAAWPNSRTIPAMRMMRRANGAVRSGRRPAKVRRSHSSFTQRHRVTRAWIKTGVPCAGKS